MKNVLITGASKGIGRQIALDFANAGYNVIANYNKSENEAISLKKEIINNGGSCTIYQCDVSNYSACEKMIEEIIKEYKHINVLINNAGICHEKLLIDEDEQSIASIINTNLNGTLFVTKFVLKNMIKNNYGKIINISSILGSTGCCNESIYSASKGAINALTKSLAKEYGQCGITVNAIAPGCVETDMMKNFNNNEISDLKSRTLLNRLAKAQDISKTALFLASDDSDYITGQIIGVDGGFLI